MTAQQQTSRMKSDLVSNGLGGGSLLTMSASKSPGVLRMSRTVMDSFNETVKKAPKIGFGTGVRPPLLDSGVDSPGPGAYHLKSTMFVNPSSTIRSPPSFTMRGREKFGSPDLKAIDRTYQLEPGPNHYRVLIVNPQESNAPKYTFPKDDPGAEARRKIRQPVPGPGQYKLSTGMGKQVLSTKKTNIGVGFGKGNRPDLLLQSTADVGPGDYRLPGATGERQVESRRRNKTAGKFPKAPRMGKPCSIEDVTPGPGNYQLPPGICGQGSALPYPSAPAITLSGREKFGSPFGW